MKAEQFFIETELRLKKMNYSEPFIDAEIVHLKDVYSTLLIESPILASAFFNLTEIELRRREKEFTKTATCKNT